MFEMNEVKGGSPYSARTYAGGDGSRQPTKLELEQAFHQGKNEAQERMKLSIDPTLLKEKVNLVSLDLGCGCVYVNIGA